MELASAHTTFRVLERDSEERRQALAFMHDWAHRWHRCAPPATRGTIIAAFAEGTVVGTVALDFRDAEPFPIEAIYDLTQIAQYIPDFARAVTVQGGRWFSTQKGTALSRLLLHAIAEHALPLGKRYLLAEVKPHSFERMAELGIRFPVFYGLPMDTTLIEPSGLRYYTEGQPPRILIVRLDELSIKGLSLMK